MRHDERAVLLRELERSGLSMAEFCRHRGLAYSTVAAWRRAARGHAGVGGHGHAGRFVEVELGVAGAGEVPSAGPMPMGARGGLGTVGGSAAFSAAAVAAVLCAELAFPGGVVLRVYRSGAGGGA